MANKTRSNADQNAIKNAPKGALQRSEIRDQEKKGLGLNTDSPSPSPKKPVHLEVWSILKGGLDSLALNDYGRPWPNPKRDVLAQLAGKHERDLCLRAAWEAREIAQGQDRAPNITGLYAKKLGELAEARSTVRGALA